MKIIIREEQLNAIPLEEGVLGSIGKGLGYAALKGLAAAGGGSLNWKQYNQAVSGANENHKERVSNLQTAKRLKHFLRDVYALMRSGNPAYAGLKPLYDQLKKAVYERVRQINQENKSIRGGFEVDRSKNYGYGYEGATSFREMRINCKNWKRFLEQQGKYMMLSQDARDALDQCIYERNPNNAYELERRFNEKVWPEIEELRRRGEITY